MLCKEKIFIYWVAREYVEAGGEFSYHNTHWAENVNGYTLVGTVDIEVEVLDIDARGKLVEKLAADKAEIIEIATKQAQRLSTKIEELLALDAPMVPFQPITTDEWMPF